MLLFVDWTHLVARCCRPDDPWQRQRGARKWVLRNNLAGLLSGATVHPKTRRDECHIHVQFWGLYVQTTSRLGWVRVMCMSMEENMIGHLKFIISTSPIDKFSFTTTVWKLCHFTFLDHSGTFYSFIHYFCRRQGPCQKTHLTKFK